jgi:hypothetical protein
MEFESIAEYLDQIETLLVQDTSPKAIADQLGIPEKQKTIYRYKKKVFDFNKAASVDWTAEKQKGHEERFKAGKDRIVDNFEFLNKLKLKADTLLDFNVGDEYKSGDTSKTISPGSLAEIYAKAGQIGTAAIKVEQELAGDDPESRKANALEDLNESELREILSVLDATEAPGSKGTN